MTFEGSFFFRAYLLFFLFLHQHMIHGILFGKHFHGLGIPFNR